MPRVKLVFFRESDGTVPMLEWFDTLPPKVRDKCRVWLRRLRDQGHDLRRPEADYLRDGIYELRVGFRGMNYRMLYFYSGREVVVVSHGLVKERIVPPQGIDRAVDRMNEYRRDPARHTHEEEV
jgi:phage-related protein